MIERRVPRSGDDLFWFNEAKKAYAQVAELTRQLHEMRGLWYGACAARTELRMELAKVKT